MAKRNYFILILLIFTTIVLLNIKQQDNVFETRLATNPTNPTNFVSSHKLLAAEVIDNPLHAPNLLGDTTQILTKLVQGTYDDIHVVFTTGCSGYQNWQAETLLYSWARVKHPGRITRIIAGCKNDKEKLLANRTAVNNNDNRILFYFVPDYTPTKNDSKGVKTGHRPFHYFNKPHGMNTWIQDQFNNIYENVIVLIDPDMIILRPFLFHIENKAKEWAKWQKENTADQSNNGKERDMFVREGHPVSQKYGIGAKWMRWNGFCDDKKSCHPSDRDAWKYYSVGPPYIMHKNDWKNVCPKWVEYSPLALEYEPQPSILAEMYSYVIACAYYDLKHEYLFSMLSDPTSSRGMENIENLNWGFLDNKIRETGENYHEFHIIHFCQGFWLGETRNMGTIRNGGWNFHKGHIPQDLLYNCEIPLLTLLDDKDKELVEMMKNRDITKDKRHYWMLYHLYKYIDQAVLNYRLKYCKDNTKINLEYKLVLQQPEADKETHRRMNYVLGEYNSKKSWRGH